MKIVLATPMYPPEIGGQATYIKELAEHLRDEHELTIVALASTSEHIPSVQLITVNKRQPLLSRLLKYTAKLFLAARGKDVIYAQNAVTAGLPAILVGRLLRKPVVIKFAGDEAWERATQHRLTTKSLEKFLAKPDGGLKTRALLVVQGFTLRRAQRVITPSVYLAKVLHRAYRVQKKYLVVNYNAAEKPDVLPFVVQVVPHQIVTTARLVEWKGVAGIIRAVAILIKEFLDVRLLIAGDGPEEEYLKRLVDELHIQTHVVFLGRVSRAETWHIRKNSQVYVLNSTYEGLPQTILTSFAAGIPAVATNIPGTTEAVQDEETGLLVEPGNDAALAHAIARLFHNSMLRKRVIEGAEKILAEKFSWQAHLQILTETLESVRAKPRN